VRIERQPSSGSGPSLLQPTEKRHRHTGNEMNQRPPLRAANRLGWGWLTNPKRVAYNRLYRSSPFG